MLRARAPWILDEMAHAGRENLDPAHVARYDQKEDGDAERELDALVAFGLGENPAVVDLGAGTGQFTLMAAGIAERVVAVDVSPVMLERLRAKLRTRELDNVECVQAGFLTYSHTGKQADLVYSRYALHHLPDFWKAIALTRVADLLRPGGILRLWDIVYSFDSIDVATGLEQWMATAAGDSVDDDWTRTELVEHVRDENSTFTWLLEPMLAKVGFDIKESDYSDDRVSARYTCAKTA